MNVPAIRVARAVVAVVLVATVAACNDDNGHHKYNGRNDCKKPGVCFTGGPTPPAPSMPPTTP